MERFSDDVEKHLREKFEGRPIRSEGAIASEIEGKIFEFDDAESGKRLFLDGEHGLVKTKEGNIYIPTFDYSEDRIKFQGLTVLHEEDRIPYAKPNSYEPLTTRATIKPHACRKEHFTETAWQEYKPKIIKDRAIIAGTGVLTALSLSAGVLWYKKQSK